MNESDLSWKSKSLDQTSTSRYSTDSPDFANSAQDEFSYVLAETKPSIALSVRVVISNMSWMIILCLN